MKSGFFFVLKEQFLSLIQLVIHQAKFPTFLINPLKRLKLALRLVCNADSAKTYKNGLVFLESHLNFYSPLKYISLNFDGTKNWEFQKSLIQNTISKLIWTQFARYEQRTSAILRLVYGVGQPDLRRLSVCPHRDMPCRRDHFSTNTSSRNF